MARAAGSTSLNVVSAFAVLFGFTSTAARAALGTSSRINPSRFAVNSPTAKLTPVRLPPGRARLATRPSLVGSSPTTKTMGVVVLAAFAANAAVAPRSLRSRRPAGEPVRPPAPAAGRIHPPPSGIRSQRSRPRHSRCLSGLVERRAVGPPRREAIWDRGIQSPASPAAAHAPPSATPLPRRREG